MDKPNQPLIKSTTGTTEHPEKPAPYPDELITVTSETFRIGLWIKWLLALVPIAIVFGATLPIAPFLHKDEFMIVDLGRIILNPGTDWSITWLTDEVAPVLLYSYLGPVMQELSFQWIGQYGPRILGWIGAFAAATIVVGWLISKGTPKNVSFVLGLVFLLDPILVQAHSMGRVDGWAIAISLAACWVLSGTRSKQSKAFRGRILLAGSLTAFAFFIWPSVVFLFPLILLELVYVSFRSRKIEKRRQFWVEPTFFMIGGIMIGVLLIIPIAEQAYTQIGNLLQTLQVNIRPGSEWAKGSGFSALGGFASNLKFTPVLVLFALLGSIIRRDLGLILVTILPILLISSTIVYIDRIIYLTPYFIALIACMYTARRNELYLIRCLKKVALPMLLVWAMSFSLVIRSILAIQSDSDNDRELVSKAANSLIGQGDHSVLLLNSSEFYYTGRELNWKMYSPYITMGEPLSDKTLQKIFSKVDYAVIGHGLITSKLESLLNENGIYYEKDYHIYKDPAEVFNGVTTNIWRLRFLFAIYEHPYGPYRLYTRRRNNNQN